MKHFLPILLTLAATLSAQTAAPKAPDTPPDPNRIVAVVEGRAFTADDLERMTAALGGNIQANFNNNPKGFVETFGLLLRLQALADQEKMAEADPHKWRLYYNRALYLAQARMNAQSGRRAIMPAEQQKYYEERKQDFSSAKIRVIYLAISDKRNDTATDQLAASIVKQARAGADFVELVKKHSEDNDSKAKGGEFPPVKPGDTTLPPAIKTAIFALKPGEISDPIRQPAGLWIFRLEEFTVPPYEEVKDAIFTKIMDRDIQAWMDGVRKSVQVEFKDPAFFEKKVAPARPAAPAPGAPVPGAPASAAPAPAPPKK